MIHAIVISICLYVGFSYGLPHKTVIPAELAPEPIILQLSMELSEFENL
jgi:hypothetical protein